MASLFSSLVVLAVFLFASCALAWPDSKSCEDYRDLRGTYHREQTCLIGFCCGSCFNRYCCQDSFMRLSEKEQDDCARYEYTPVMPMVLGIGSLVVIILIFVLCCVCPCCCLYKACRRPRPVIATTTHTTVVTSTPQTYPQQPTANPQPHGYQPAQYPAYQPVPVQPGYGAQPMPYQGAPYTPGPPPTYQEATGPSYPAAPVPYSQAAFTPGQTPYPLQPPGMSQPQPQPQPQAQANAPQMDFLSQPAYNPDYMPNKM